MEQHIKHQIRFVDMKNILQQYQMTRAGYRQEFCNPLHQPQQHCGKIRHGYSSDFGFRSGFRSLRIGGRTGYYSTPP